MKLTILGATGSIGMQTLDVVALHQEKFTVEAITANRNHEQLLQICKKFNPKYAVLTDNFAANALRAQVKSEGISTEILTGMEALVDVARLGDVDCVVAGIVGSAGLLPLLAAIRAGKRVLFANKEPLVMAGELFMAEVRQHNALLLPVDSEHNAIFQCLGQGYRPGEPLNHVRRVILTASGGPFRTRPLSEFNKITPEQACAHPTWQMGRKISVDSATLFNKGLEVIEAHYLFALPKQQIDVVIHPQSVIHSLVEYVDGSLLSQMGLPDMRIPITNCLAWPNRIASGVAPLNLLALDPLIFSEVDLRRYPCYSLALDALNVGGNAGAIINAANEVAVSAFLQNQIGFQDIYRVIAATVEELGIDKAESLAAVIETDHKARQLSRQHIAKALGPSQCS